MHDFWNTNCILKVIAGSHSYGMNTLTSDIDTRGVCIPPPSYLLGLDSFEQYESKKSDMVIYSLKKFVKLALENNPNILDVLFVDRKFIIKINQFGEELRNLKYHFLSKRVFKTYGGYAYSRLKNITEKGKNPIGHKAELITKHGYDTKDAAHLIRLMRMAIEILENGEVNVYRPDHDLLLAIRNGSFSLKEIIYIYKSHNEVLNEAYEKSQLPEKPNYKLINDWLTDAQYRSIKTKW